MGPGRSYIPSFESWRILLLVKRRRKESSRESSSSAAALMIREMMLFMQAGKLQAVDIKCRGTQGSEQVLE